MLILDMLVKTMWARARSVLGKSQCSYLPPLEPAPPRLGNRWDVAATLSSPSVYHRFHGTPTRRSGWGGNDQKNRVFSERIWLTNRPNRLAVRGSGDTLSLGVNLEPQAR